MGNKRPVTKGEMLGLYVLSIGALCVGLLFYLLVRPEGSAVFLKQLPTVKNIVYANQYAEMFNWLPSFVHVLSFSLLSWLAMGRRLGVLVTVTWCLINLYFEFSQIKNGVFSYFPGTFDVADVVACLLAVLFAVLIMQYFQKRELTHELVKK